MVHPGTMSRPRKARRRAISASSGSRESPRGARARIEYAQGGVPRQEADAPACITAHQDALFEGAERRWILGVMGDRL